MGRAFRHKGLGGGRGKSFTLLSVCVGNVLGTIQPSNKKQTVTLKPGKSSHCGSGRNEEHRLSPRRDSHTDKRPPPHPGSRNPAPRWSRGPYPPIPAPQHCHPQNPQQVFDFAARQPCPRGQAPVCTEASPAAATAQRATSPPARAATRAAPQCPP